MANVPKFQLKDSTSKLSKNRARILAPSQSAFSIKKTGNLSNDIRLQNLKERIIGQDSFINFGSRPISSKVPGVVVKKRSTRKMIFRDQIQSHSRPISPILKSNNLMRSAMDFHQPISHLLVSKKAPKKK
jgi:hypothetical protein